MKVEFQSKHPHNTVFLFVEYDESELTLYHQLRDYLTVIGMFNVQEQRRVASMKPTSTFSANGSGPFGSWTKAEKKLYMDRFRRILKQPDCLGLSEVPYRKLTLEDLL